MEEQDKERAAAVCIQNYYRRYKQVSCNKTNVDCISLVSEYVHILLMLFRWLNFQYAYFKQMTHAAMVIQHGYRSYCAHKRFKKGMQETNLGMNNAGNTGMYSRAVRDSGKGSPGSLKWVILIYFRPNDNPRFDSIKWLKLFSKINCSKYEINSLLFHSLLFFFRANRILG